MTYTLRGNCFKYSNASQPAKGLSLSRTELDENAIEWATIRIKAMTKDMAKQWGQAYAIACLYNDGTPITMFHAMAGRELPFSIQKFDMTLGQVHAG